MKLFHLDNFDVDDRYCAVDVAVSCISELIEGTPARPIMEEDGEDVLDLQMDEDTGLDLGDYVPNPDGILPLRKGCAEAIAKRFDIGEHDCLNQQLSDMDGSAFDPTVVIMGKWCLHAEKIPPLDLFRVKCFEGYIFSERLVAFIQAEGYKNFSFNPATIC